jgi:ribosome maturation protein SDO1
MSKYIKAPNTQKRLTNIVVVRLQKNGKRYEVACYPNKIEEWRSKIETDIDEVLQRVVVYTNVSKGQLANKEDLLESFETKDQGKVCRIILDQGQLQVSEKERKQDMDKIFKDVASLIVEKCINSETKQPFPLGVIENAMRESHVSVNTHQSAKQQALKIIPILQEKSDLPIERAKMRLQLTAGKDKIPSVLEKLKDALEIQTQTERDQETIVVALIEPRNYREVDGVVKEVAGRCEVLQHYVKPVTEGNF